MPGAPPTASEPRPVYVPAGALLALSALRVAAADRAPSLLLPGEPGWRTRQELADLVCPPYEDDPDWLVDMRIGDLDEIDDPAPWRAERESPDPTRPRSFLDVDLTWLVRTGLAQRFGSIPEPGRRHVVLYPLTPLGAAIVPLEWQET